MRLLMPLLVLLVAAALLVYRYPSAWGAVASLLSAAMIAWTLRARRDFSTDRFMRGLVFALVAAGLLIPALCGLYENLHILRLARGLGLGSVLAIVAAGLLISALVAWAAARWPERWGERLFYCACSGIFLVFKLGFIYFVRKAPVSDFAGMQQIIEQILAGGLSETVSSSDHLAHIHLERILPFFLPMETLFGTSRWAYAVPNVLACLAMSFMVAWLARKWWGKRAARVAFGITLLAVEPTLAAGIPSHDLAGSLYFLIALLLLTKVCDKLEQRRYGGALAFSLTSGIALVLLDLQRGTADILLMAAAVIAVSARLQALFSKGSRKERLLHPALTLLLLAVIPYTVATPIRTQLRENELMTPATLKAKWMHRGIVGHTDSWGTGRHPEAVREYYQRYALEPEEWRDLAFTKLASDFYYNPVGRVENYLRKADRLFSLGTQYNFYLRDAKLPGGKNVSRDWRSRLAYWNTLYASIFLLLAFAGVLKTWGDSKTPWPAMLPAIYIALLAGGLILLFQVQPRYMFQFWYVGGLYIGALLAGPRKVAPADEDGSSMAAAAGPAAG